MRRKTIRLGQGLGILLVILGLLPLTSLPVQARGGSGGGSLFHDSFDDLYRTPLGPVPVQTPVTLRFAADARVGSVTVRVWDAVKQKQQMLPMSVVTVTPGGYNLWEATLDTGKEPTIYWYRFILTQDGETVYYEDNIRPSEKDGQYFPANEGGSGMGYSESPDLSWQITVYDPDYYTPEWMRNAVIYQIFPDRFRDSDPSNDPADDALEFYDGLQSILHETWNEPPVDPRRPGDYENRWNVDFFGGDLAGITEKLDYLQSLGVTAIYLNPIFAARSNHRYDTADYKAIDPVLGDLEDFQTLVSEAQKRGMVLILDGVFNHLSSDSVYFDRYHRYGEDGACESVDSKYRNWFFFVPPKGQQPSVCVDNPQGATYYTSWAGYDSIPKVNSDNDAVRLFIYTGRNSVVNTWGREGIGGWRLDVGGDIDKGGPTSDYWEGFRVAVRNANPEGVIIGEEWGNASAWLLGSEWDSVMNYRLRRGILGFVRDADFIDNDSNGDNTINPLTPTQIDGLIQDIESNYPPMAYDAMMNILGSHDTSRLLYVAGDTQRQRLAALLQFMLPGAPTIYYGDEIALDAPSQADGSGTVQDDPYNRAPYPWPDASGDTYGPPDEDMLAFYQQLGALRGANPALREGRRITLLTDDTKGVYAFLRLSNADGNAAVVVLNRSTSEQTVDFSFAGLLPNTLTLNAAFGGDPISTDSGAATVTVPALSGEVWTATAEAPFTTPEPPATITAQGGLGSVALTWDAVPGAAGYRVYRSPVAVGGFRPVSDVIAETTYTDTTAANGYRFYYAIASSSADGLAGSLSRSAMAVPSIGIAEAAYLMDDAPQAFTLAYGSSTTITASLLVEGGTAADAFFAGIQVEAALMPKDGDLTAAEWVPMAYTGDLGDADVYAVTIPVLAAGDFVQVVRYSANAGETWTVITRPDATYPPLVVAAPDDTIPPDPPASVTLVQATITGVVLAWEASPSDDVAAYRVYRTGGDETKLIAEIVGETRYTDKAVAQGDRYSYAITAVDQSLNESEPVATEEAKVERRRIPVTFIVTVPDYTSQGEGGLYIAGDFGADDLPFWDPAGIPMEQIDAQHWQVTFDIPEGSTIQYKYARGTWNAVEKGTECEEIANRTVTITVPEGQSTLTVDGDIVAKWRDLDKCG